MKKYFLIFLILISSINCIPAAIVGASVNSSAKKKAHQQWMSEFQKTNMEREKAHLKPLDFCDEAYRYDKKWALRNDECKEKFANKE